MYLLPLPFVAHADFLQAPSSLKKSKTVWLPHFIFMEFTQFSLFLLFFLFWKSLKMCSLKFHSELTKCATGKTEISDSNLESFEFLTGFEKIAASVG